MSIASEITRLQNIKTNIRSALVTQGVPAASGHDMADFSADILSISTGGGATITVTYSSEFYNKTMTCTKGTTTYTETTTSSGSTVFNVDSSGTWTITCNGVSRTIDVVLEYITQMAITQTVTVYSAASDTVSFTDATGAKTVTTNTSGQGSVSITFIPNSTITFTSSVSKNPSNLSQNYSKTVSLTTSTTSVSIMPNNCLYWYGYSTSNLENSTSANGWSRPIGGATWNTRDITIPSNGGIGTKNKISATKILCIGKAVVVGSENYYYQSPNKNIDDAFTYPYERISTETLTKYELNFSINNGYVGLAAFSGTSMNISALWYE